MSSRSIVTYLRDRPRTAVLLVVLGAAAVIFAHNHPSGVLTPSDEDMAAVRKGQAMAPIGKPLLAADVPWPRAAASAAGSSACMSARGVRTKAAA